MKYSEVGFRAVYKQFCVFPKCESLSSIVKGYPGMDVADGVLCYGYIDHEAGVTLEVLAGTIRDSESSFRFFETLEDVKSMIRIEAVKDEDFYVIDDPDGSLYERYAAKLDMLKHYDVSEEIEKTRGFDIIDSQRHKEIIDDVLVFLYRKDLEPEGCWVKISGLGDHWIMGKLLNEPEQDFGYHLGELIAFFIHEQEDGSFICVADMNPDVALTEADLEDGSLLEAAVKRFNEEQTEANFIEILQLLRDSYVWIPCGMILGESDQQKWEEMIQKAGDDLESLIGETLTTDEEVRLVPDVLQNGDDYFFPVFSTAEEMGEYGNGMSKVQKHFLEALSLAANNERNVKGIVLNAFSEAFVLDRELFDMFGNLKSRIMARQPVLYGALIGDMVGSPYEWYNKKTKDFELFSGKTRFTDDSAMTIAVAEALMDAASQNALDDEDRVKELVIDSMQKWGNRYPHAGYGRSFRGWLKEDHPTPYGSWGNGSAMRVSAAGWIAEDLETTRRIARWSAEVTHNHPEGIKGAEAVSAAIFMARKGSTKEDIKSYVSSEFGYDLDRTCDEIRPTYEFDVSCQGSVPEAIIAFLEGEDFEDVVRTAVSLGGDSDTIGAMAGSIAEAFYGVPNELRQECEKRLPEDMKAVLGRWNGSTGTR